MVCEDNEGGICNNETIKKAYKDRGGEGAPGCGLSEEDQKLCVQNKWQE